MPSIRTSSRRGASGLPAIGRHDAPGARNALAGRRTTSSRSRTAAANADWRTTACCAAPATCRSRLPGDVVQVDRRTIVFRHEVGPQAVTPRLDPDRVLRHDDAGGCPEQYGDLMNRPALAQVDDVE